MEALKLVLSATFVYEPLEDGSPEEIRTPVVGSKAWDGTSKVSPSMSPSLKLGCEDVDRIFYPMLECKNIDFMDFLENSYF
jgi:hypothetical protein